MFDHAATSAQNHSPLKPTKSSRQGWANSIGFEEIEVCRPVSLPEAGIERLSADADAFLTP